MFNCTHVPINLNVFCQLYFFQQKELLYVFYALKAMCFIVLAGDAVADGGPLPFTNYNPFEDLSEDDLDKVHAVFICYFLYYLMCQQCWLYRAQIH